MKADKVKSWRRGVIAEHICVWLLRLKGYRVLAKRYKTKVGEIDIVARRGQRLVFIEVKARRSLREGMECIAPKQRERIAHAAQLFLARSRHEKILEMRFDVMVVVPWRLPYHLKDAWRQ